MRQKFDAAPPRDDSLEHLTMEQVRRAMNAWLEAAAGQLTRAEQLERELTKQQYYQRRNAQARRSHTKTRKTRLKSLGIDAERIRSCIPDRMLFSPYNFRLSPSRKWRCPISVRFSSAKVPRLALGRDRKVTRTHVRVVRPPM